MPPREAKSRFLTREYMADRDFMTTYSADEREWYLLTALHSDDAGWLSWDVGELAAALYRWEDVRRREAKVTRIAAKFSESGRLVVQGCGRHATMPRVANRPRHGGKEYAVKEDHDSRCDGVQQGMGLVDPSQPKSTAVDRSQPKSTPTRARAAGLTAVDPSQPESTFVPSRPIPSRPIPSARATTGANGAPSSAGSSRDAALRVLGDPNSSDEAKAGAQAWLQLGDQRKGGH